jgi:hypothetical protein
MSIVVDAHSDSFSDILPRRKLGEKEMLEWRDLTSRVAFHLSA